MSGVPDSDEPPPAAPPALHLDCCVADDVSNDGLPSVADLAGFAALALDGVPNATSSARAALRYEVSVRIVGTDEGAALNERYRGKPAPTNVLSFPSGLPVLDGVAMLGDLVFCAELVQREAQQQGKPLAAHWAHLVVHGVLHLLGHDHQAEPQALAMEALESRLLSQAGIADPYRVTNEPG